MVNTADHDSREVRTQSQPPLRGYNAQMVVNDRQIVLAAEITTESPTSGTWNRWSARPNASCARSSRVIPLADAGYWHQRQIQQIVSQGMTVLIPPDGGLRKGARPDWTGGLYDSMRCVLATPEGRALYRERQITIEPVFGQISSTARSNASHAATAQPAAANGD